MVKAGTCKRDESPDFAPIILKGVRVGSKLHELHLETSFSLPKTSKQASATSRRRLALAHHRQRLQRGGGANSKYKEQKQVDRHPLGKGGGEWRKMEYCNVPRPARGEIVRTRDGKQSTKK